MNESAKTWEKLLVSAPVNKLAAVNTNQHACSASTGANLMVEERRVLRENIKVWSAEMLVCGVKRRKELRPILRQANKRFTELNIIIKNNPDMKSASRYETWNHAFVACAREMLPQAVLEEVSHRANEAFKV